MVKKTKPDSQPNETEDTKNEKGNIDEDIQASFFKKLASI